MIEPEHALLGLINYIHLNPVRAKIVRDPKDYPFNNYCQYAYGIEWKVENLFQRHPVFNQLGTCNQSRSKCYRDLAKKAANDWAKFRWQAAGGYLPIGVNQHSTSTEEFLETTEAWVQKNIKIN